MNKVHYFDTDSFLYVAKRAEETNRNRQVYTDRLAKAIDPDGIHVVQWRMPHNDVEWRCLILIKMKDTDTPVRVWLDVSFMDWTYHARHTFMEDPSPLEQLGTAAL